MCTRLTGDAAETGLACDRNVGLGEELGEGLTVLEPGLEELWLILPGDSDNELTLGDSNKEFWAERKEEKRVTNNIQEQGIFIHFIFQASGFRLYYAKHSILR